MSKRIIIIDSNASYRKFLFDLLVEHGYTVESFDDELLVLNKLPSLKADLLICSFELENIDGETFYTSICEEYQDLPVIFTSSVKDESIIISMLQYKTCEFMVKPIVPAELLARVKVLTTPPKDDCVDGTDILIGDLRLDLKTKMARRGKKDIILTPTEFRLLEYLMSNKNIVLSRDSILNKVWGTTADISDRIVDVYIGYLREKVDDDFDLKFIETVTGFGYKITG